jgi:hypothetical protein
MDPGRTKNQGPGTQDDIDTDTNTALPSSDTRHA